MNKKLLCLFLAVLMLCSLAFDACAMRPEPLPEEAPAEAAEGELEFSEPEETATPEPSATAEPSPTAEPTAEPTPEAVYINPLSGEETNRDLSKTRPIAVMVENNHTGGAMINQAGISQAEILYEIQVEQITRCMAIFSDVSDVPAIYPIRSARTYFVSTALAYDAVYIHCGESAEGLDWSSAYLQYYVDNDNLNLGSGDDSYRIEVWPHTGEHGLATSGELLTGKFASLGTRLEHKAPYDYGLHFTEDAAPENGESANTIRIVFPSNKITGMTYAADLGGYTINQWDTEYIDDNTKEKCVFENVLVLAAPTQVGIDMKYHSAVTVSDYEGDGLFFNGGKMEHIKWKRGSCNADSLNNPFYYYDSEGNDLELGVGHTYIAFVSSTYGGATCE